MSYLIPKNIEGARDELPSELIAKNKINRNTRRIFRRYGYSPLHTSTFEKYEFLYDKYGEEEEFFYHVKDESGADLVMRYDLIVPMLRVVSQYPELSLPLRYYHLGRVWRNRKPGKLSWKEFMQLGFAVIGSQSFISDLEIVDICCVLLSRCELDKNYLVRLSNRKILGGFLRSLGVDNEKLPKLGEAIGNFYYLGEEAFLLSLKGVGVDSDKSRKILDFIHLSVHWQKKFPEIKNRFKDNQEVQEGLDELLDLTAHLKAAGIAKNHYKVDFSVAKRLHTFTGFMFEVTLENVYMNPKVIAGGRYDDLMGSYLDIPIPAVGATVSYDRIYMAMLELGIIEPRQSQAKVLIVNIGEKRALESLKIAKELRSVDINAAVYTGFESLEKQIRYAAKKTIPLVIIFSNKDLKEKRVVVKETKNGREQAVERKKLATYIKKKLGSL